MNITKTFVASGIAAMMLATAATAEDTTAATEIDNELCISEIDQGTYGDVIQFLTYIAAMTGNVPGIESFATGPQAGTHPENVSLGHTFMRISAVETGHLMIDNENETICEIAENDYQRIKAATPQP